MEIDDDDDEFFCRMGNHAAWERLNPPAEEEIKLYEQPNE